MKLRSVLLSLTAITFLGASSFASSVRSSYVNHSSPIAPHSAPSPHDTVLYDNGPDDGVNAFTISNGFDVSNSFNLAAASTLNSVTFSNWFFPGTGPATSVDWQITDSLGGGTILFSGVGSLSNVFLGTNGLGADVYSATFSLGGLNLGPGTFFLDLANEQVAGGNPGFWGESNGPSVACQSDGFGQCDLGNIPSENFSISGTTGVPPPVPEPSSLVLLGTGLLGAAGAMRRKFGV